ncbi:MAG: hypothetical protein JNL70_02075 [Saprospiraceae bacterium]|nr:hypothetical protein [Saprospiraceae bacterium]
MKKKQIQFFSIVLLIISVGILYSITDRSSIGSILGLISGALSALASVISLYMPSSYTQNFSLNDWEELNDTSIIEINARKHGMGKNPTATIYLRTNTGYEQCICDIEKDDNGNITIKVSNHFKIEGKVVITG